jgi:biotin synthase-related radical SAM superfamily protein
LPKTTTLPQQIRISLGTAIVLGLLDGKLDASPTTAYLMTYKEGKCTENCGFCPQARTSKSNTNLLSRVTWPIFLTSEVLAALTASAEQKKIGRVCIQALNYPGVFGHLEAAVKEIKKRTAVAVSVSCQPRNKDEIWRLKQAGVDRLGIALDAANETLFNKVKGKETGSAYTWENQFCRLKEAIAIFKEGNVSTHLIVGLGETEKEAIEIIQRCVDMGVLPALFAFTPIRGTALEDFLPPKVESYRRVQLARYLIVSYKSKVQDMEFDGNGVITNFGLSTDSLDPIIESTLPFRTSGCPNCNRPFYNEKPSGPIYNYPIKPSKEETEKIKRQLSY